MGRRTPPPVVDDVTGCWIWQGKVDRGGYGRRHIGDGYSRSAHRMAYEEAVGPVPDELQVDHRCSNRRCVNPEHLRLATPAHNSQHRSVVHARSGERNVYADGARWRVFMRANGHKIAARGTFATIEEAAAVARELRATFMPLSKDATS